MIFREKNLKFDIVEKLHHELTNIVYSEEKAINHGIVFAIKECIFILFKKYTLCSFYEILFKHDLIDNMSARDFLQRNMDNGKKLEQFLDLIWPFF